MSARETAASIAVFGGSFDPPHCAHVMVASWVLSCGGADSLLVVPTYEHPFAKESAPFRKRVAMCRAAFACFGRRVRVLDVESRLPRPSYTVQTLRHLHAAYPGSSLTLVVGSDIPPETPQWRDFDEVRRLARVLVVGRQGAQPGPDGVPVFPDVSSTSIRSALASGGDVSGQVPSAVLGLIRREGLYGAR
jgi:nicotinate-nucleotide adenylyltransferase